DVDAGVKGPSGTELRRLDADAGAVTDLVHHVRDVHDCGTQLDLSEVRDGDALLDAEVGLDVVREVVRVGESRAQATGRDDRRGEEESAVPVRRSDAARVRLVVI